MNASEEFCELEGGGVGDIKRDRGVGGAASVLRDREGVNEKLTMIEGNGRDRILREEGGSGKHKQEGVECFLFQPDWYDGRRKLYTLHYMSVDLLIDCFEGLLRRY